jgi:Zn-dependent protease
MAFFSVGELVDVVLMTLFVGYIFSGYLGKYRPVGDDPIAHYQQKRSMFGVDIEDLKFAAMITAPAIILHELGHKFVALAFGIQAQFNAAYFWLILGVVLKLMNFGFIFFVPAYVTILGGATHLQSALIAGAGPFVNLLLWGIAWWCVKNMKLKKKWMSIMSLTSRVNMFLFFFNMSPFFFFDGYKFFKGMFGVLF